MTPTTKAGRALLDRFTDPTAKAGWRAAMIDPVLAIEREAAARERERLIRSDSFRTAIQRVFDAPGEWGPAKGYYREGIDHFIEMLAAAILAEPRE